MYEHWDSPEIGRNARSPTALTPANGPGRAGTGYIVVLCEVCGSIDIVRARTKPLDRLIRLFTGKNVFACRRCGWRGRRSWSGDKRVERPNLAPESDPNLAGLDGDPSESK